MSTKLIQKHLLKQSEYEIVGEQVDIRVLSRVSNEVTESLSVTLAVLNPEPIITRTQLQFVSRVNGEPLISLALSRPNVTEFNEFVNTLKLKAQEEYNAISGIRLSVNAESQAGNSYEEPPEFSEHTHQDIIKTKTVNIEGLDNAINMLRTYIDNDEIQPLLLSLEALKQAPHDKSRLADVANVFNNLGSNQGAVLTYAPYISIMLSDDRFGYK